MNYLISWITLFFSANSASISSCVALWPNSSGSRQALLIDERFQLHPDDSPCGASAPQGKLG
ncbi:hypothetical protein [Paenibacillus bovis]|uniref:Uncharacterized protein n=1 Tax=Paenibacillus bovis TaxID=1616788 RepID=A0A1X9T488_9BACL|nr:hypothetical protein [Paenibacillus bovis]ARR10777.1 hypothetical protein AR543_p0169 [Paenibacillus bovis]